MRVAWSRVPRDRRQIDVSARLRETRYARCAQTGLHDDAADEQYDTARPTSVLLQERSQQSTLGKRHHAMSRDDEMVQGSNVHERKGLLERLREQLVRARGFGDA